MREAAIKVMPRTLQLVTVHTCHTGPSRLPMLKEKILQLRLCDDNSSYMSYGPNTGPSRLPMLTEIDRKVTAEELHCLSPGVSQDGSQSACREFVWLSSAHGSAARPKSFDNVVCMRVFFLIKNQNTREIAY